MFFDEFLHPGRVQLLRGGGLLQPQQLNGAGGECRRQIRPRWDFFSFSVPRVDKFKNPKLACGYFNPLMPNRCYYTIIIVPLFYL